MQHLPDADSQFKQRLLEAVDEGLQMLGESGKKAVYFHLQNLYSLKREDIPDKPETFVEGLKKIFGMGAQVIEKGLIKSLCSKLGINYKEAKETDLLAFLNETKDTFEKQK